MIYRKLIEEADDIGDDNPMAYNEMFALVFVAPYIASEKKIPPEIVQEMMRRSLYSFKWYFSLVNLNTKGGKEANKKNILKSPIPHPLKLILKVNPMRGPVIIGLHVVPFAPTQRS